MRVANPNYVATAASATDKTDLQAALLSLASTAAPNCDQIRTALGATKAARFTDALIECTARSLGYTVTL
jgi:hypothetical protein